MSAAYRIRVAVRQLACLLVVIFALAGVVVVEVAGMHVRMESKISRERLHRLGRSNGDTSHEVIFAVNQKNLDQLERTVLERSTPGNSMYQKWMTFDEVGRLISNPAAHSAVLDWLTAYPAVRVTWKSRRGEYIKASASLSVWEELFDTQFYEWEDTHEGQAGKHHLADHYGLPEHLQEHVTAVFGTVQVPPLIVGAHRQRKGDRDVFKSYVSLRKSSPAMNAQASGVTVAYLDSLYRIGSNIGTEIRIMQHC
jgi:subtilase family serine protease